MTSLGQEKTGRRVGFITYDLQEFAADCLSEIDRQIGGGVTAYPVFSRVATKNVNFRYRPGRTQGAFFAVRKKGSTPESFTSSINVGGAIACVAENDIIVLYGLQGLTALLAAILGRLLRRKVVSVNQTLPMSYEIRRRPWIRALKWMLLHMCNWHISQSPVSTVTLEEVYGIDSTMITLAPFEAGASRMKALIKSQEQNRHELRQKFGWAEDLCVFVFVGTLLEFKGVRTLISATAQARSGGGSLRTVFVGPEAPQETEPRIGDYQRHVEQVGAKGLVEFMGPVSLEELAKIYLAADVVVLPTEKDTFGKVLAEGAMAKRPHITTTACGAVGAIVEQHRTGFVVPPSDVMELSSAMTKMLDPRLRTALGAEAQRAALAWCNLEEEARGFCTAFSCLYTRR